jgi:hypothetical protein
MGRPAPRGFGTDVDVDVAFGDGAVALGTDVLLELALAGDGAGFVCAASDALRKLLSLAGDAVLVRDAGACDTEGLGDVCDGVVGPPVNAAFPLMPVWAT